MRKQIEENLLVCKHLNLFLIFEIINIFHIGLSFTRPSQLLQIYTDMEETNLSLIQHSQASEETLERVNQQILATRVRRFCLICVLLIEI